MSATRRRAHPLTALCCLLALVCAACSAGEPGPPPGAAGGPSGGFPVSLDGKFGRTTVPARPVRVVAMSWTDADLVLGLGVVPVGMARVPTAPGGIQPWTRARLGDSTPALFDVSGQDPIEAVAALAPDLIVATKDYNLERSYPQLSAIAPVVSYRQAPNQETWDGAQRSVAAALGRGAQGDALVADTRGRVAAAASAHPGLRDRSFSFVVGPLPSGFYLVNSTQDASAQFLAQLGLRIAPAATTQPTSSIPGRALLSWERIGLADADLVVATGPPRSLALLAGMPGFQALPAVAGGRYLDLEPTAAQSIAFPSAVSLAWAVDTVVPRIATSLGT